MQISQVHNDANSKECKDKQRKKKDKEDLIPKDSRIVV